jgi:AcrR family transcriptional regulator
MFDYEHSKDRTETTTYRGPFRLFPNMKMKVVRLGIGMDRRIRKTEVAITEAFIRLLGRKGYQEITIQEILDEADVGRSTFYAHFGTKDELLRTICADLFAHIFSLDLDKEPQHDFSHKGHSLQTRVEHLCDHLYENRSDTIPLLTSGSRDSFVRYMKDYLTELFQEAMPQKSRDIPSSLHQRLLVDGFISLIQWWGEEGMKTPPDAVSGYYWSMFLR